MNRNGGKAAIQRCNVRGMLACLGSSGREGRAGERLPHAVSVLTGSQLWAGRRGGTIL